MSPGCHQDDLGVVWRCSMLFVLVPVYQMTTDGFCVPWLPSVKPGRPFEVVHNTHSKRKTPTAVTLACVGRGKRVDETWGTSRGLAFLDIFGHLHSFTRSENSETALVCHVRNSRLPKSPGLHWNKTARVCCSAECFFHIQGVRFCRIFVGTFIFFNDLYTLWSVTHKMLQFAKRIALRLLQRSLYWQIGSVRSISSKHFWSGILVPVVLSKATKAIVLTYSIRTNKFKFKVAGPVVSSTCFRFWFSIQPLPSRQREQTQNLPGKAWKVSEPVRKLSTYAFIMLRPIF